MGFLTPEFYQGKPHYKNYFEGWYFKLRAEDYCIAVIVGLSLNTGDAHAFIQTLDSEGISDYTKFPLSSFYASRKKLYIKIDGNTFSEAGITLNLNGGRKICGTVNFHGTIKYPRKILSPNIMGPFNYIPKLSCNHAVVFLKCGLSGALTVGSKDISFDDGTGYSEKDYGKSFPSDYFWLHADNFDSADISDVSVMAAVADVPMLKKFKKDLKGIIAFIRIGSKFYNISTYNGAKISGGSLPEKLTLKNRRYTLELETTGNITASLKSPVADAAMKGEVTETLRAKVSVRFSKKDKVLFSGTADMASMEYVISNQTE